nr:HTH domain-containing protein [Neorhodopirellula lusitana]
MRVLHLISGRGRWDVRTLAEELECSQRTVHRMLSTLSMAGVPWYFDEKIRAYKVRPGFKFPMVEQVTTDDMNSCSVESDAGEIQIATTQLIEDGEAFAESLEHFLTTMKAISNRCQDS